MKEIPNHKGYFVDTDGNVWSQRKGVLREMKLQLNQGRLYVSLGRKHYHMAVHRLVALTFHGNAPVGKGLVCHNNGVSTDNRPENLRWDDQKGNKKDELAHGTRNRGSKNGMAKLTIKDVELIKSLREDSSLTQRRIGQIFGVSQVAINQILHGKRWTPLDNNSSVVAA